MTARPKREQPLFIEAKTGVGDELAIFLMRGARGVAITMTTDSVESRAWLHELADVLGRAPEPIENDVYSPTPIFIDGKRMPS